MRIAICDDNQGYDYNSKLKQLLTVYLTKNNIRNYSIIPYTSGVTLVEEFSLGSVFDFIFLDIDMPGLNGFETAGRIRDLDSNADIIFVTHMAGQMQLGFRYGAKDYLCKPITQQHIDDLLDRLRDERRRRYCNRRYRVKLKKQGGEVDLNLDDILYFESIKKDIHVEMKTGKAFMFRGQISQLEIGLKGKGFVLTHRSFFVNMMYMFALAGDKVIFNFDYKGLAVPVSRGCYIDVKEAFDRYRGW